MDEAAKKAALRLIPYGMFVLTTRASEGPEIGSATINWVTQASFKPPLVAIGVKADSRVHQHIKDTGVFAMNVIGKDQRDMAFTFFKPQDREGNSIGGEAFEVGLESGCALLLNAPAWWECKVVGTVEQGDHTLFVGEVIEAGCRRDDLAIFMRDHNLFYGG